MIKIITNLQLVIYIDRTQKRQEYITPDQRELLCRPTVVFHTPSRHSERPYETFTYVSGLRVYKDGGRDTCRFYSILIRLHDCSKLFGNKRTPYVKDLCLEVKNGTLFVIPHFCKYSPQLLTFHFSTGSLKRVSFGKFISWTKDRVKSEDESFEQMKTPKNFL